MAAPNKFYNRFEKEFDIVDEQDQINRLNNEIKKIIFGFFLFDKTILRDIGF